MKRYLGLIVIALCAGGAVWGAAELVLRMSGYGKLVVYEPDPDLYWAPLPNQRVFTKIDHQPVTINAQRSRGDEFDPQKPAGVLRILSLGDSRTFGWGIADEGTFSALLEDRLQAGMAEKRVEVVNAGVNGWSYDQMLTYLKRVGLAYSPDAVVVAEANLWTHFNEDQGEEFRRSFAWRVRIKNWLRRSAIYHYVVEVKLQRYYLRIRRELEPSPAEPRPDEQDFASYEERTLASLEKTLTAMSRLLAERSIPLFVLHIPRANEMMSSQFQDIKQMKLELCAREGCTVVDATERLLEDPRRLYLEGDPIHPNAAGHRLLSDTLWETLGPALHADAPERDG